MILSAKGKSQRKFGQSGPGMKELMDGLEKKYDAAMDKLMEQVNIRDVNLGHLKVRFCSQFGGQGSVH